jgi:hypothetical protein
MTKRGTRILVSDNLQKGYTYLLSEPAGRNFHPDFKPELTPKQMLALGVFGGVYLNDCPKEFPTDWFKHARLSKGKPDPRLNYFTVEASKPLAYWQAKGWIYHEDPRGWFQWYCRYYLGRRCPDDARQIRRWKAIKRHVAQLKKHCPQGALDCRRRQRQALLHWAYDSRKM